MQEPTKIPTSGGADQTAVQGENGFESRQASTPMMAGNQEEKTEETSEPFAHSDDINHVAEINVSIMFASQWFTQFMLYSVLLLHIGP